MNGLCRWLPMLVVLAVCSPHIGIGADPPPSEILSKVRSSVQSTLAGLPNYTCVQTVKRYFRRQGKNRFEKQDALRLEVALIDGQEMFSWPGEDQFQDTDVGAIVQSGISSSGSFALYLRTVFEVASETTHEYVGSEQYAGRSCFRFDFDISKEESHQRLRLAGREVSVAISGSYWADGDTLDLAGMEVRMDEMPEEFVVDSTREHIEYQKVPIGASKFLLPAKSVMTVEWSNTVGRRNVTQFENCRQYAGESVISFGAPAPEAVAAPVSASPDPIELPEKLTLKLVLQSPIDSETSMVGDKFTAVVSADVKRNKRIVVPRGSVASGRILCLARVPDTKYFGVALRLNKLTIDGVPARFRANFDGIPQHLPVGTRLERNPKLKQERFPACQSEELFFVRSQFGEFVFPKESMMQWKTAQ